MKKKGQLMLWIIIPLALIIAFFAWTNSRSVAGGIIEGKLKACPKSPNSVSSYANDDEHAIAPFPPTKEPMKTLHKILKEHKEATVIKEAPNYLHVEFSSKTVGFIDDVEFLLDDKTGELHIRSASRCGYNDQGVNRARMEMLRAAYLLQSK